MKKMSKQREHIPVLLKEVVDEFKPEPGKKFIDATLGFGGHTEAIIKEGGSILGVEWDPEVLKKTKKRLSALFKAENNCPDAYWKLVKGNFRNIKDIAENNDFCPADGVLFDLGISRWHYKKAERGFSFEDESLDMRINPETNLTAQEIINSYSFEELNELFSKLVQEKLAEPIARTLVSARGVKPITSGRRLAEIIEKVYQKHNQKTDFHPATKIFLALRIRVNAELENLEKGLKESIEILKPGGKTLVITFHSGEDRMVKLFGRELERKQLIKTNLIFPTKEEIKNNPLARSAKLRVLTKLK